MLDATASYPNGGSVFNIGRETTHKELIKIEGISEQTQRRQSLNISGGATNSVEIATELFSLPSMSSLLMKFENRS